ncbi:potassium-transporting ATPase subunit KdpC [Kribbella deserti]|uniref:Potassium-transporting ATPase KdpC subunit n=1 Tax=Kribbella deserti TaxID=1926257 RepID=A0ABV6QJ92_9ACTN
MNMLRQLGAGVRALAVFTLLLGLIYPLAMTGAAQAFFPDNANGSLVRVDGKDVASDLIGQTYAGAQWFQSRPSAVKYDGMGSGASQYGPKNAEFLKAVEERRKAVAAFEGVEPEQVPVDAVTASASGLDPHISPAYAALQVFRVALERGIDVEKVRQLVAANTEGRTLGFLGAPRVNIVTLNRDLAVLS